MNTLRLINERKIILNLNETIFQNDNLITALKIQMPDTITVYPRADCQIELRAILPNGDYLPYTISTSEKTAEWKITNDLTESPQTIKLLMVLTHNGNVIGRTNAVEFEVKAPAETVEPLTPRAEFDEVIAKQRETISNQQTTIDNQTEEIEEKDSQISGLNTQVGELQSQNEQLETDNRLLQSQNETSRQTIQNMLDNPPQPKLQQLDPINPSGIQQTYNPESPNIGFPQVIVNPPTAESINFHPEYYKEGEECVGKVGTYNPFPYQSKGGIYYTEVDNDGYPIEILVEGINGHDENLQLPSYTNPNNFMKILHSLKRLIMKNCNNINGVWCNFQNCLIEEVEFSGCKSLYNGNNVFLGDTNLRKVTLNQGFETIPPYAFDACTGLKTINFPSSLILIKTGIFRGCTSLEFVSIENGFNCDNLVLSSSTLYSEETIVSWLEALADRTGETAYTLTIGTANVNKLSAEQIAIATNKNWNLN